MLYVNFEEIDIPETWRTRAQAKLQNLKAKEDKTSLDSGFWGELRPAFASIHGDKCWYCENGISGSVPEIEHFRPKNKVTNCEHHPGYWWLAYECTNYRLSCSICNNQTHKGNNFPLANEENRATNDTHNCDLEDPLLLDPFDEDDCNSLECNIIECTMSARQGPQRERAEQTIQIFGLDKAPHIRDCGKVIKTLQGFLILPEEFRNETIRNYIENSQPGFSSFIHAFLEENEISLEQA
jgi:uncharacterized protein (TIGR02646 family)